MSKEILRIAMWSGPRNISTAMMRSWENRSDTFVSDEPLYAHYLAHTGLEHPGRKDIIESQPTDWQAVAEYCLSASYEHCSVHYQKHMTQHVLPHIELDWLESLNNIFLIRTPAAVVASYARARPNLNASDLGFEQQARLFRHVKEHINSDPLVISSAELLQQPQSAMELLCQHLGLAFETNMLQWPAGKRASDGVWAPYWYKNVEQSTGFSTQSAKEIHLDSAQQSIADQCQPYYDLLASHALHF